VRPASYLPHALTPFSVYYQPHLAPKRCHWALLQTFVRAGALAPRNSSLHHLARRQRVPSSGRGHLASLISCSSSLSPPTTASTPSTATILHSTAALTTHAYHCDITACIAYRERAYTTTTCFLCLVCLAGTRLLSTSSATHHPPSTTSPPTIHHHHLPRHSPSTPTTLVARDAAYRLPRRP